MAQIAPGLTYYDVDIILKRIINFRYILTNDYNGNIDIFLNFIYMADLIKQYNVDLIKDIIKRYFGSHYKRKHLPIRINSLKNKA